MARWVAETVTIAYQSIFHRPRKSARVSRHDGVAGLSSNYPPRVFPSFSPSSAARSTAGLAGKSVSSKT